MRMWMVNPTLMCRKHLLGEHVEIHMLAGTLRRGRSIDGFLEKGLLEPAAMAARHAALVEEMLRRGYKHTSPLEQPDLSDCPVRVQSARVNPEAALEELRERCPDCRARQEAD